MSANPYRTTFSLTPIALMRDFHTTATLIRGLAEAGKIAEIIEFCNRLEADADDMLDELYRAHHGQNAN